MWGVESMLSGSIKSTSRVRIEGKMNKIKLYCAIFGVGLITASLSVGTPVLGTPWSIADGDWAEVEVAESNPLGDVGSISQPNGLTTIRFNFRDAGGDEPWQPIGGLKTATQAGDWSTLGGDLVINFTLSNINNVAPPSSGLRMYFTSAGGTFYSSSMTAPLVSQSYQIAMESSMWGNLPAFTLVGVTDFGFQIAAGNSLAPQSYEFSNIYLSVPEPESIWMALIVLASLGITFRGRLSEVANQVKARIKA